MLSKTRANRTNSYEKSKTRSFAIVFFASVSFVILSLRVLVFFIHCNYDREHWWFFHLLHFTVHSVYRFFFFSSLHSDCWCWFSFCYLLFVSRFTIPFLSNVCSLILHHYGNRAINFIFTVWNSFFACNYIIVKLLSLDPILILLLLPSNNSNKHFFFCLRVSCKCGHIANQHHHRHHHEATSIEHSVS